MKRLNVSGPKIEQFLKNPFNMYRNKLEIAEMALSFKEILKGNRGYGSEIDKPPYPDALGFENKKSTFILGTVSKFYKKNLDPFRIVNTSKFLNEIR